MPESEEHSTLVSILHSYIAERFCYGNGDRIVTDSQGLYSPNRPPSITGYVPDAYVALNDLGVVVIGEAKSMTDLENSHTEDQITAFLKRCELVEGSVFVLAVPWPVERLARSFLLTLQAREGVSGVETVVLSEANH